MSFFGYDPSVADKVNGGSELDRAERFMDNALEAQRAAGNELKGIGDTVFTNAIHNLPNPQKSWLYEVDFKSDDSEVAIGSDSCPVMKITLPKLENKTIERWYKGTKRTYVINQDRSGTTDIEVQLRSDMSYNAGLIKSLIGVQVDLPNFFHSEFHSAKQWTQVDITLRADVGGEITGAFTLYNPIIQNVSFSDLSYASSDAVTMTITIHYDWWISHEGA